VSIAGKGSAAVAKPRSVMDESELRRTSVVGKGFIEGSSATSVVMERRSDGYKSEVTSSITRRTHTRGIEKANIWKRKWQTD